MIRTLSNGLAILAVIFFSITTFALAPDWQMVPDESNISFTATQNNAPVAGQFKSFTSSLQFDPNDLKNSHIEVIVDLASLSTSYKDIADTLKTPDWFNVNAFPKATFEAHQFKKIGDDQFTANGKLTIRDKTLPIALDFKLDEYSATQAKATGRTTLKRTDFGVGQGEWSQTDSVKDDVTIQFKLVATKK